MPTFRTAGQRQPGRAQPVGGGQRVGHDLDPRDGRQRDPDVVVQTADLVAELGAVLAKRQALPPEGRRRRVITRVIVLAD